MSVVRKVFSDSAFTAVRSIVSLARGIVLLPIITKLLGADSYGLWVTILATVTLISSTGGMHLHGSLIRYESEEVRQNQTYSDVLVLAFLTGVVLALGVLVIGAIVDVSGLLGGGIGDQYELVVAVAALVLAKKVFLVNVNYPRARGHVKLYDLGLLCRDFGETMLLAAVFLLGGGIVTALSVLAGFLLAANVAFVCVIGYWAGIQFPDFGNFWPYVRYGVPMIPKEVSSTLLSNADKYVIIYFVSPSAVGIYAAAKGICQPLVKLTKVFDSTLYPTIGKAWDEGDFAQIADVYGHIFRFYSILAIPAMVGLVVVSEAMLTVLSTTTIARESVSLVPVFVFGFFLKGYDNSIRYILTSAKRTEIIGGSVLSTVVVNVVLNILFVPRFGILGAAVATLASHVLMFTIVLYFARSLIPIEIPWQTMGRSGLAAGAMAIVLLVIDLDVSAATELVVYPAVGAFVYFACLQLLGEFSATEIDYVKGAVRR